MLSPNLSIWLFSGKFRWEINSVNKQTENHVKLIENFKDFRFFFKKTGLYQNSVLTDKCFSDETCAQEVSPRFQSKNTCEDPED